MTPRFPLPALAALLGLVLAPLAATQSFTPMIDAVDPAQATEGTEFTVTGQNFGPKRPKLFLARDGQIVPKTRLKVLQNQQPSDPKASEILVARVLRAPAGVYQLAVRIQGQGTTFTDAELEIVAPTIVSVSDVPLAQKATFAVEVEFPGTKRRKVRIAGKKSKVVDTNELENGNVELLVRGPKLPNGAWDLIYDNRVGRDYAHQAITVTGSPVTRFPDRYFAWTVDGQSFFSRRRGFTVGSADSFTRLQITAKAKRQGTTTRLGISLPFRVIDETDLVFDFTPPLVFEPPLFPVPDNICQILAGDSSCDFVMSVSFSRKGLKAVYESQGPADQQHTVYLNAKSENRLAGSFFGQQTIDAATGDLGPDTLEFEGSFVARRRDQPFAEPDES